MEYPLGELGSAASVVSPPSWQAGCLPSSLAGGLVWEAEKTLTLYKHCSAVVETSVLWALFAAKSQNVVHTSCCCKKWTLSPAKTSTSFPVGCRWQRISVQFITFHSLDHTLNHINFDCLPVLITYLSHIIHSDTNQDWVIAQVIELIIQKVKSTIIYWWFILSTLNQTTLSHVYFCIHWPVPSLCVCCSSYWLLCMSVLK